MLTNPMARMLAGIIIAAGSSIAAAHNIRENALYHAFHTYSDATASFLVSVLPVTDMAEMRDAHIDTSSLPIYPQLAECVSPVNRVRFLYRQIAMLHKQRSILADQTKQLLDHIGKDTIHGYAEIATPGTYIRSLHSHVPIYDPVYVVGDARDPMLSLSPHVSRGFQAHSHFVDCDNFQPITQDAIPDHQVDLVTCYPGLHHVPADRLDAFVASIARILKPGGVLVIREHDIGDHMTTTMAHTAHELFNAYVANLSQEASDQEYRNFQPLVYWKELLARHGLHPCDDMMLTQSGDPTANTLFACIKQPYNADEAAHIMHAKYPGEHTQEIDTYLSTPEWFNVDASQAYGEFLNHTPFYEFPYMRSIATYWKILFNSVGAAYQRGGISSIMKSPYFAVSTFIGTFMTIEYGAKACISWPLSKLYGVYMQPESFYITVHGDIPQEICERYQLTYTATNERFGVSVYRMDARYKACVGCILRLSQEPGLELIRINGHENVQCKVKAPDELDVYRLDIDNAQVLYDWMLPTDEGNRYYAIAVPVTQLLSCIRYLRSCGVIIEYIHDF